MNITQTPVYRRAGRDVPQHVAAAVIVGLLILTGLVATVHGKDSRLLGQLLAEDLPAPTAEERQERFELIVSRTQEQYADMRSLIALDIEQGLEQAFHGSAPTAQDRLQLLREQRWQQEGAWWEFMMEEFARWFGLTR